MASLPSSVSYAYITPHLSSRYRLSIAAQIWPSSAVHLQTAAGLDASIAPEWMIGVQGEDAPYNGRISRCDDP